MGKPVSQGQREVDLCASIARFYATNSVELLKPQPVANDVGEGWIEFHPIGVLLAVEPWNFPIYQESVKRSGVLPATYDIVQRIQGRWGAHTCRCTVAAAVPAAFDPRLLDALVRQLQEYLHPCSEHLIDWFHITMRLTVLQQQAKGLQTEQRQFGQETSRQLESVKHLLWHGNTEEALERIGGLNIELDLLRAFSPAADKLGKNLGEFETYIRNNIEFIPNFGER